MMTAPRSLPARVIAWLMIAMMASPLPAIAQVSNTPVRDTAIYLAQVPGSTSEPNIMLVMTANDRMNVAEPWREVPGEYNSHIEYLWAEPGFIRPNNWVTSGDFAASEAESAGNTAGLTAGISLRPVPTNPTLQAGHWGGATHADRLALSNAAYNSSTSIAAGAFPIPGDPGPRWLYRNYGGGITGTTSAGGHITFWTGDPNWLWWVPTGTEVTSPLLWAPSFNKFAGGGPRRLQGLRGNVNYATTEDFRNFNQCMASRDALTPNTVFAPTSVSRNAGRYLNQPWLRWEPYLRLDESRASLFPTTLSADGPWTPNGTRRIADVATGGATVSGTAPWTSGAAINPRRVYATINVLNPLSTTSLVSDNGPSTYQAGVNAPTSPGGAPNVTGPARLGQGAFDFVSPGTAGGPVRMRIDSGTRNVVDAGDSYAGWAPLRADHGGANHWWHGAIYPARDAGGVAMTANSPLRNVLALYGLTVPGSIFAWDRAAFVAMRGHATEAEEAAVNWWQRTGLRGYFTTAFARGSITAGSNLLGIDRPNAFLPGDERYGRRINVPGAGASGDNLVAEVTAISADGRTLTLSRTAITTVVDTVITVNLRAYDRSVATCTRNCAISPTPVPSAWYSGWTRTPNATAACITTTLTDGGTGACLVATPPACGSPTAGAARQTITRSDCTWTGRQSVFIEGVGTRFYGGACTANCSAEFPNAGACIHGPTSPNYCGPPIAPTVTIGGVTYPNFNATGNGGNSGCGGPVVVATTTTGCSQVEPGFSLFGPFCTYNRGCASTSATEPITAVPATDLAVINRAEATDFFVHDCLADNGTSGNYLNSFLNRSERRFGAGWNQDVGTTASGAQAYRAGDPGGTPPPAIDVYSANYLNWRFGPRGPNGHPIGRATRITLAKNALTDLVTATNGVRFGLIVSNRTRADLSNDGAYVAFASRRMGTGPSDPDFANRQALANAINGVQARSRTPLTETLYETMLYYAGRAPQWGTDTSAALIGGQVSAGRDPTAVCTAIGPGCPAVGVYRSPMLTNPSAAEPSACQKNFVVLITNGQAEEDFSANTLPGSRGIRNLVYQSDSPQPVGTVSPVTGTDSFNAATASGQFVNPLTGQPFGMQDLAGTTVDNGYLWLDELAYFMRNADMSPGARIFSGDTTSDQLTGFQGVITYVVGFRGANSPVLQQAAQRGDGLYYEAADASDLRNKLQQAITNITSFSGTLASATVPLASYNRSESGLDVYMSFFEPSANRMWRGTLKRYRLGLTTEECGTNLDGTPNTFCLMGQTTLPSGNRNIVAQELLESTGLVTETINSLAVSFWNPLTEIDGRDPARGGTGFQLRSLGPSYTPENRRVYTKLSTVATNDLTAAANQLTRGNAAITTTLLGLGASDTAGRARLINFIRGGDMAVSNCNGALPSATCNNWAPWAHADVLHSKVAQVYYNVGTTPPVQTLFYLTNDGLLHAVDANTGREQWAFLVEEALPQLQAMQINGSGQQIQAADGSPAVYVRDDNRDGIINGSDQVILVFNLRRGGRSVYALDVTAPSAPRFLWKITGDGGGQLCTGGTCASQPLYAELGQTWSAPVVTRANGHSNPVAIFGAGYDPNQDNEPVTASDTMGRAVFVVDLLTGAPVRRFDGASVLNSAGAMTNSIPSTPAVFDLNGDGKADIIYVGDTGGRLFRFQISDLDPGNWSGKLLARLSNTTPANRKILFPPTVVPYITGGERIFGVFVGTGDREHPFKLNSADVIAMIVDRDVSNTLSSSPPVDFDSAALTKLAWDDQTAQASVTSSSAGWVRLLPPTVKVTESPNVQTDLLRVPVYGRASDLGFASIASTCTPSFVSRLVGYSGLESKIVVLPGSSSRGQLFQGNIAQNFIGAPQVLFLPDGRIVLFSSGGAAGVGAVQQIGQRNVARVRSYWYVDPN